MTTILLDVALLVSVCGDGVVPESLRDSPLARESAIRTARAAETHYPWEWHHSQSAQDIVDHSREWLLNNKGAPALHWAGSLPTVVMLHDALAVNEALHWAYREGRVHAAQVKRDAVFGDLAERYAMIEAMLDASDPKTHRRLGARRLALLRLQVRVGDAAFCSGNWPSLVPLWAVPDR